MKERKWEDKIIDLEKRIKDWVDWMNGKMEQIEEARGWGGLGRGKNRGNRSNEGDGRSKISGSRYTFSRRGSSYNGSRYSEDELSERKVRYIRKWVVDKEKEERKCNIVIKGKTSWEKGENGKEWVESFIKEKLRVQCKVTECRNSGPVIVAKIENEEKKKEVMRNKNKLKGDSIFIENDLSWEERRLQERINRWAREKRMKGVEVKIGLGRVRIAGIWRA